MKKRFSVWTLFAAVILCAAAFLQAQDSDPQPPSLADLARRSRAQHDASAGQPNKAQQLVDAMQREQDTEQVAPTGFKSYDAGDYRIFVPFPNTVDQLDNGGVLITGSNLGVTNTEVALGTPMAIPVNLRDIDLLNLAQQIAMRHSQSASCEAIPQGPHKAFHCNLTGASLGGRQVWGNMEIIVSSNGLIPVMCVSPDDLQQCVTYDRAGYHTCANRAPTWSEVQQAKAAVDSRNRDERTTGQMCEQIIYPSIQLKEDAVAHPVSIGDSKPGPEKPGKPATGSVRQDNSVDTALTQTPSLAEMARQSRQAAAHGTPQAKLNNSEGGSAPAGFQSFTLQYCVNPQICAEATIVIPERAEVLSRANGQYIFKASLNGDPVLLYAGPADVNAPYRSMTDPDFARIRDLANANLVPREKIDEVSTQELTVDNFPALMTRFRYLRDPKVWWIGERTLMQLQTRFVQMRTVSTAPVQPVATIQAGQFMLGCTAPEPRFADAEALCTTLVNSLRLEQ
jgi:hypothetical protein